MNNVQPMNRKENPRRVQQPVIKEVKLKRTRKQWLELFRRAREIAQTTRTYELSDLK